jgi:hypothetical protein
MIFVVCILHDKSSETKIVVVWYHNQILESWAITAQTAMFSEADEETV